MYFNWLHAVLGIFVPYLIFLYFRKCYEYWEVKGIKVAKPIFPVFGSMKDVILGYKSIADFARCQYNAFQDEQFVGVYNGLRKILVVRDPILLRCILLKDFEHFTDHGLVHNKDSDLLADNLLFMEGSRWKLVRKHLSPVFTSGKLKNMYDLIQACGEEFKTHINQFSQGEQLFELKSLMDDFTMTVIGSTAFGIDTKTMEDRNCTFRITGNSVFAPSLYNMWRVALSNICPFLFRLFKVKFFGHCEKFFLGIIKEVIHTREKGTFRRNDFIDTCVELKKKGVLIDDGDKSAKVLVTDELLAAQAFLFFTAGYATSAATMSFALYELALNPDLQETLYSEIKNLSNRYKNKLSHDYLQEATYLDNIVDETLRKYPPIGFMNRVCSEPYTFGPEGKYLHIEKGIIMTVPVLGLHRDPKYYPNPEIFNPERFSPEAIRNRPPFVYLPFGEGPRICIGQRFAKIQVKVGIVSVLQKFLVVKTNKTPDAIDLVAGTVVTKAKGGLWVKFIPRKDE